VNMLHTGPSRRSTSSSIATMERTQRHSSIPTCNGTVVSCGRFTVWAHFRLTRDAPNTWPQHQYIALKALRRLPNNISSGPLPSRPNGQSTFALVPAGQLGMSETELPGQPITSTQNATATGAGADINLLNGTVTNGGNASTGSEGWASVLERGLANRYYAGTFCSW
jgi:alpha,alpha-trehalase